MLVKSKKEAKHVIDLKKEIQIFQKFNMHLNQGRCGFGVRLGKLRNFRITPRAIEANLEKIRVILEMSPPKMVRDI